MPSKIYIDKEGNLSGLADDVLDKLTSFGPRSVERVSEVEFDHNTQQWVAVDKDGNTIASDSVRSRVIDMEREHLNKIIEESFAKERKHEKNQNRDSAL